MDSIASATTQPGPQIRPPLLDRAAALTSVGDDLDLLREIGALFLAESPRDLAELETCVRERNPIGIERTAHRLKGSIGAFGRGPVYQAALRLQEVGRARDLRYVETDLVEFGQLFRQLCDEIRALISA